MKKIVILLMISFFSTALFAEEIGYVIRRDNDKIFIDQGRSHFTKEGDFFGVFKENEQDYFAIIKVLEAYQESSLTRQVFIEDGYRISVPDRIYKIDKQSIRKLSDTGGERQKDPLLLAGGSLLLAASGFFAYKSTDSEGSKERNYAIASVAAGALGITLFYFYF